MADDVVVTTSVGTFAVPDEEFARLLRQSDGHQRTDIAVMRQLVRPGDLVLDVGAFVGTVAVPLARAVGPDGCVVAFEALPVHVRMLRDNVVRNGVEATVTVVPTLISSRPGAVTAHSYEHHSSASTWYEPSDPADETALDLPSTTLDAWYARHGEGRPVALIKVDVEGMDLDVLRGAERILAEHHPALHVEVASFQLARYGATLADLDRFLRRHGYRQYLNLAQRNAASDEAKLGRCASTRFFGPALGDVVAVHRSSVRASELVDRAGYFAAQARFAKLWLKRVRER